MDRSDRTLVISDGGLGSLVACAAAHEASAIAKADRSGMRPAIAWTAPTATEGGALIVEAVERQASTYGLKAVIQLAPVSVLSGARARWPGLAASTMLIQAAAEAVEQECDRVVWPVHFGGADGQRDIERIALAVDRALLITRIMGIDAGEHSRPALRIETPYVDLTDQQIADLALDLDAPVETCWWWKPQFAEQYGRITARSSEGGVAGGDLSLDTDLNPEAHWRRWGPALRAVGWIPEPVRA